MLWEVAESEAEGMFLQPACQEAGDWLTKKHVGQTFDMSAPKTARSPIQHRKFWATAHKVYDNWPEKYEQPHSVEDMVDVTKISLGRCREYKTPAGHTYHLPESIAYANMDGEDFTRFFDLCVALWARIIGCTPDDLLEEVK